MSRTQPPLTTCPIGCCRLSRLIITRALDPRHRFCLPTFVFWIQYADLKVEKVLIGNKCDLTSRRVSFCKIEYSGQIRVFFSRWICLFQKRLWRRRTGDNLPRKVTASLSSNAPPRWKPMSRSRLKHSPEKCSVTLQLQLLGQVSTFDAVHTFPASKNDRFASKVRAPFVFAFFHRWFISLGARVIPSNDPPEKRKCCWSIHTETG